MEQGTSADDGAASPDQVKLCECGCGQPAPIAKSSDARFGYVKGQPKRFILGHSSRRVDWAPRRPDLEMQFARICDCGCGEPVPLASHTDRKRGLTKGQPVRFVRGHASKLRSARLAAERQPSAEVKLCECGCGESAPIAADSAAARGRVKGLPIRFIHGHNVKAGLAGAQRQVFVFTGQQFGASIVTDPETVHVTSGGRSARAARLTCGCGTEYVRTIWHLLRNPDAQSCGECPKGDDLAGRQFGRLTVIRRVPGDSGWLCRCVCGNEVAHAGGELIRGRAKSCGCLKTGPRNGPAFRSARNRYRVNARSRDLSWCLTDEDFLRLTSQDCHYCGAAPANVAGTFVYNGIDRMDNDRGYEPENVVPCCPKCNWAKRDMPYDEFLAWIARLASFHFFRPDMTPPVLLRPTAL